MKNKIALCLILGNEEKHLPSLLTSFEGAYDCLSVVFARGNQKPDKSEDIIADLAWGKAIAMTHYENREDWPHVDNFGAARQLAWKQGENMGVDWLMWADADDTLSSGGAAIIRESTEKHEEDAFVCEYHTGREITLRERIVRVGFSEWQFPVHEQLKFLRDTKYRVLRDVRWMHQPKTSRAAGLDRNERILKTFTDNIGRNAFYLHQQYFQIGQITDSKKYAALALAGYDLGAIEAYEIKLNLSQMEEDPAVAKSLALEAYGIMPDRREALCLLTEYYLLDGNKHAAYGTARAFINLPKPKVQYWSLNHDWYGWKGLDLYCRAARTIGEDAKVLNDLWGNSEEPIISVIHATLGRPEQAAKMRNIWLSLADNPRQIEYIFGLHSFDKESVKRLSSYRNAVTDQSGAGPNLESAASISRGKILVQAQDDIFPVKGWDTELIRRIGQNIDKPVFVAVGDGHRKDKIHVTSIMTRSYMNQKGGFGFPGYFSMYWDTENSYRAYKDAKEGKCELVDASDLIFYHDHPAFVKGKPWDETYRIENDEKHYRDGLQLFCERNPEAREGWENES